MTTTTTILSVPVPWPADVLIRFANLAAATVDITRTATGDTEVVFTGACTGCLDRVRYPVWCGYRPEGGPKMPPTRFNLDHALGSARTWGQEHAERCRALPRPDGTGPGE